MALSEPGLHHVPAGAAQRPVARVRSGKVRRYLDHVAEEVPVAFVINEAPFAVMMATPADLEDFALGFMLSEGIVGDAGEVELLGSEQLIEGIEIRLRIPARYADTLDRRRRSLSGRSGCGVCGSELLEAALRRPEPVGEGVAITTVALRRALRGLHALQGLARLTGATHAAAWADADGQVRLVREDVGRHNALDKLIGAMFRAGENPQAGFALVTSRASYEMAMKAASAGIALLAAVSAPTVLAISLAEACNLTLVGFAREDGYGIYTHPRRMSMESTS